MKKTIITITVIATLVISAVSVYASDFKTPVQILSDLTGKTTQELYDEKANGTFGSIAEDEGVLDQFKNEMLDQKKEIIEERVQDGTLTREEADELIKRMEENIENCTGLGNGGRLGMGSGAGFGMGGGACSGSGRGLQGAGKGLGRGL